MEDLVAETAGAVTDGLGDVRLADSGGADQEDVLRAVNEGASGDASSAE